MKRSIAEQVRAYMNHMGEDFSAAKMAEAVAFHQRELPVANRCKRQNIESLLEKDFATVRYMAALAKAMGTTVEALDAGIYFPPKEEQISTPPAKPPQTPHESPSDQKLNPDLVITQYDIGGSMGSGGKLLLEAKSPGIIKSWRVDQEWLRLNVPIYTCISNLCIVTGFGSSMKPIFNPGDPLLMDLGVNHVDHEGIYFFSLGDEGFIKIIQRVPNFDKPGFVLRIISKNKEDFPPYDISSKHPDFRVIGKILTVWRSEQY